MGMVFAIVAETVPATQTWTAKAGMTRGPLKEESRLVGRSDMSLFFSVQRPFRNGLLLTNFIRIAAGESASTTRMARSARTADLLMDGSRTLFRAELKRARRGNLFSINRGPF
jgi:hypothetical protein